MKKSIAWALAAAGCLLTACNGWPTTRPFAEAVYLPEKYPTYSAATPEEVPMFYAGNHRFMVMPAEFDLRVARTTPVTVSAPFNIVAIAGDQAPYANLFARGPDGRVHAVGLID